MCSLTRSGLKRIERNRVMARLSGRIVRVLRGVASGLREQRSVP